MMEQKKLSRPNKLGELFLFQISYVLPREYGGRHLLEACPRHVSVHALLAECDSIAAAPCGKICGFNPRTPCGVRQAGSAALSIIIMFQSTHSLRSATLNIWLTAANTLFQSTHSLRSATLSQAAVLARWMFQSTHSLRSATPASSSIKQSGSVSIHALLAECDILLMQGLMDSEGFNPRTPCGVRLSGNKRMWPRLQFQSTHSLRSATWDFTPASTHRESFNPRTPCGVRLRPTLYIATQQSKSYFAPTSLKRPSLHGCSF